MNCFEHPLKPAVGSCTNCGRGLCKECTTVVEGKLSCRGQCQTEVARSRQLFVNSERASDERKVIYGTTAKMYHQAFASTAFFALLFVAIGTFFMFFDAEIPGLVLVGLGIMMGVRSIGLSRAAKKYKGLAESRSQPTAPQLATA